MITKLLKSLTAVQTAVLIILGLVLVNLLASLAFFRLDLTRNGIFTISPATKSMISRLDDLVTIKVYFTDNLPAPYSTNRTYIQDQLEELSSLSDGMLNFQMIDPSENETFLAETEQYQIPALQVQVFENERMEVKKAYMGLVVLYENQSESLPVLQQLDNFEFDLATTINRMVNKKLPVLATSTDFGMPGWSDKQGLQKYLEKQYQLTTLSIENPVPDSVSSLILFTPSSKVSSRADSVIQAFLARGGRLAWFFDRVRVNPQMQSAQPVESGLDSLFARYGVTISDNLVQDLQCASISVPQNLGFITINNQVEFPWLPVISSFPDGSPLARGVNVVTPIFASEISLTSVADSFNVVELLKTSSKSRRTEGYYNLDPFQEYVPDSFTDKELPVAVTLEGRFGNGPESGRLLLMTDGEFVSDQYIQNGASIPFFLNVIYWISPDDGLLAIPSKKDFMVPLPELSPALKQILKYSNLLIPPVLVLVWGVLRWRQRKRLAES
ncbi:MAG: GldG family protein [Bacteroidetes bacterium]|nr:GldG family protein [Bacteroidota bacterium]